MTSRSFARLMITVTMSTALAATIVALIVAASLTESSTDRTAALAALGSVASVLAYGLARWIALDEPTTRDDESPERK